MADSVRNLHSGAPAPPPPIKGHNRHNIILLSTPHSIQLIKPRCGAIETKLNSNQINWELAKIALGYLDCLIIPYRLTSSRHDGNNGVSRKTNPFLLLWE